MPVEEVEAEREPEEEAGPELDGLSRPERAGREQRPGDGLWA